MSSLVSLRIEECRLLLLLRILIISLRIKERRVLLLLRIFILVCVSKNADSFCYSVSILFFSSPQILEGARAFPGPIELKFTHKVKDYLGS